MKNRSLLLLFQIFSFASFCQTDTALSLHIIGDKVCIDRNKLQLNFSYYYENHTNEPVVVIDDADPCFWEMHADSARSPFVYLIIQDDTGKVILPTTKPDSNYISFNTKKGFDSATFLARYSLEKETALSDHTFTIVPKAEFVSLFSLKLNKRKCFNPNMFEFNMSRKYTFHLVYVAKDDIRELASQSGVKNHGRYFLGKISSNKVELCFK